MRSHAVLQLVTPLALRSGRERDRAETHRYIPGGALLGALANAHSMLAPQRRDEFADLFVSGKVHFGNFYPANFRSRELADMRQPVRPMPLTARTCKRFPGFLFQAELEREERHGVYDALIPAALFQLSAQRHSRVLDPFSYCRHPGCDQSVDRETGFYRQGDTSKQIGTPTISRSLRTHTGISRQTGAAADAILYSREMLDPPASFRGALAAPDQALLDALRALVDEANVYGLLRIGTNRTRGLGRVTLELAEANDAADRDLEERARAFDRMLRSSASAAQLAAPHGFYISLTLLSDAILHDSLLRSQLQITPEYLGEVWGLPDAELIYQSAGQRLVAGWSEVLGLPRADERAIQMGSVFLFGLPDAPDFTAIEQMQREGIGARQSEGFGRVRLADPFHLEEAAR